MRWRWTGCAVVVPLVALVGCDHATKYLAKSELENHPPRALLGSVLTLRYVENRDVAFNLLRSIPAGVRGPLLIFLGALAIALLVARLARWGGAPATRMALVLILSGALGNTLDRLARGYVVDFIQVPHWPVFNVADVCVTVGAGLLGWKLSRRPYRASQ